MITPEDQIRKLREELRIAMTDSEHYRGEAQRLNAEVERLTAWLRRIEGGDNPSADARQLGQWAYEAVTLGHACPEA